MSVIRAIGRAFKKIGVTVAHGFVRLFGSDVAHDFAKAAIAILKTAAGQIALSAVTEAMKVKAKEERYDVAFSIFKATAANQGLQVSDSVANMLIEIALQQVKKTFGEQP